MSNDLGTRLARVEKALATLQRSTRLGNASIENGAIPVYDDSGSLRAVIGQQPDGTTAVTITNGPPPPAPTAPALVSVLGGVAVSWEGDFADGQATPLDWARVEVHTGAAADFTPSGTTLRGTLESPQGGTLIVPVDGPVYALLQSRNTSGTASDPSATVGPVGPQLVVAQDILDGIVTTVKLADDAVTQAKVATGAIGTPEISDDAVTAAKVATAAIGSTEIADGAVTTPKLVAGAVQAGNIAAGAVQTDKLDAQAVTTAKLAAGAVTATELAAGSVIAGKVATDAIQAGNIAAGAVTTAKLAAGAVTANELAANAVTTAKLAAGAVTASVLDANAVNGKTITGGFINGTVVQASTLLGNVTLVYNGTPGAGKLILSIAPSAGTDSYGNAYVQGFAVYGDPLGNNVRTVLNGGTISVAEISGSFLMELAERHLAMSDQNYNMTFTTSAIKWLAPGDDPVLNDPGGIAWDWVGADHLQRTMIIRTGDRPGASSPGADITLISGYSDGTIPRAVIGSGQVGRCDVEITGNLKTGGGHTMGRGVIDFTAQTANVGSITTAETEVMNTGSITWKAGRAYRVTMACYGESTVAGDIIQMRLRKANTTGTVYHDYFDTIVCTRASQNYPWQGTKVLVRPAGSDLAAALSLTATRRSGTGTLAMQQSGSNQPFILVEDIGDAADYPNAYAIA